MIPDEELKRLLELEAKATPEPWFDSSTQTDVGAIQAIGENQLHNICMDLPGDDRESDRALIVQARNLIRPLVEEVLRLRAIVKAYATYENWNTDEGCGHFSVENEQGEILYDGELAEATLPPEQPQKGAKDE